MKGVGHRLWSGENARNLLAVEIVPDTFRQGTTPAVDRAGQPHLELSQGDVGSCEMGTHQ
jgi:hypothetical protein